jgi:Dinucleotide-utilizing enzymes involved in molybdopterin and thiamine biosynthesis family 2
VSRPKTIRFEPRAWQEQAIADLCSIATEHPESLEVISSKPILTDTHALVVIRLPTKDLSTDPRGLQLLDKEEFVVGIAQSPLVPPLVDVKHIRFAGHPHVLQGRRLCIYLDPAREWDPVGGMSAFLDRLWAWLADAAAGRFNAATAMYHAVGGVLHRTPGTPTIVVREPIPCRPSQRAHLMYRTEWRQDLTFESAPGPGPALPVLTLACDLPFGAGVTLAELLTLIDNPYSYGPPKHVGLGPRPARAVLTTLATSAIRNASGSQQYFGLAVPHPSGGPTHLLVGRLPITASDELRESARSHGPIIDVDPSVIDEDIPIEWCGVSDERSEVTTRRDEQRPVNAFQGKNVHVWGCGGLGSWIAEFVTRAGAARISLCDPGNVTGGLLVRQDYVEEDIGQNKAQALATRLQAINDHVEVIAASGGIPADIEDALASDVIIDATVSIAVARALSAFAASIPRRALLAQVATDTRTGTLGILVVSAPSHTEAPEVIDRRAGEKVLADAALEQYHSLWQEPLEGHEITPTRGCSVPTFHGSAADLAAVAACLVSLLGVQLPSPTSGIHLIALPYAGGAARHHHFIEA